MVFAAVYAIVVGLGMIGQWAASYRSKRIPELETEPIRIGFHIVGEMATAVALIVGGMGLLTGQAWGQAVYLIASGLLLYTAIVSPGYFAQKNQWPMVGVFAVVLILTLISIVLVVT
jgi:hypothetical protein